jgi:predicted acylesterase/phospholipase RssA
MMIGSGGAVSAARARGAWVVTPPTLGVGLLEFHQLDRMIEAGRSAARALLDEAGGDLLGPPAEEARTEPPAPPAVLDQVPVR